MSKQLIRGLNKEICERLGLNPNDVVRLDFEPDVCHAHLLSRNENGQATLNADRELATHVRAVYYYEDVATWYPSTTGSESP